MKILGLVASQRILGNSEIIVKDMLASLPDTYSKEMIRLTDLDIKMCTACYSCLPKEKACILEDDLLFLINKIKEADGLIIASPCYFLGEHTIIKKINDRLLSLLNNGEDFVNKKCVSVVIHGVENWQGYARETIRNFCRWMHLDLVGDMEIKAANPGEVVKDSILKEARILAKSLINQSIIVNNNNNLVCSICGNSILKIHKDGTIICPMCNGKGLLELNNNIYSIKYNNQEKNRFTTDEMNKHGKLLENIKSEYLANKREFTKIRKEYKKYDWWIKP